MARQGSRPIRSRERRRPLVFASLSEEQLETLVYVSAKLQTDPNSMASTLLGGVLNTLEQEIGEQMTMAPAAAAVHP